MSARVGASVSVRIRARVCARVTRRRYNQCEVDFKKKDSLPLIDRCIRMWMHRPALESRATCSAELRREVGDGEGVRVKVRCWG